MRGRDVGGVFAGRRTGGTLVAIAVIAGAATVWNPLAAVLLAGVLLILVWPVLMRIAGGASWALPLVVAVMTILLDFMGIASSSGVVRYTGTAIVLAVVLAVRGGGARTGRALWFFAAVLCVYGLFGTIFGRFWFGTRDGAFPVVLPMLIFLAGWTRQVGGDADLRLALKVIAFLGSLFTLACAAVRLAGLTDQLQVYGHERAFLMILAVACAMAAGSRPLIVFSLLSVLAAFATYPAATYVVAGLTALLTLALVRWSPNRVTRTILGVGGMAGTLWAVLHVDALVRLSATYFVLVGKTDNGSTRATLYEIALQQLEEPWFAHFFTGDLTVISTLNGGHSDAVLPIHNDYLGIALSGGIVAAALLLSVFMFANGCAIHAVNTCGMSSLRGRAITSLLASLNVAAVTAFANPVFMNPGGSTAVYAIIFALISLCVGATAKVQGREYSTSAAGT